jgi:PhnB protein
MKIHVYRKYQDGMACADAMDFYQNQVFGAGTFSRTATWDSVPSEVGIKIENSDQKNATKMMMHMGLPLTKTFELCGCDDAHKRSVNNEEKKDDCHDTAAQKETRHSRDGEYALLIIVDSKEEADKYYADLSGNGGSVTMPMADMFWGDYYGMCTDVFGTHWMVNFPGDTDYENSSRNGSNKFGDNKVQINIHRAFDNGQCAAAFDFYQRVFGGEFLFKATYADAPPDAKDFLAKDPDSDNNKIMHQCLAIHKQLHIQGHDVITTIASPIYDDWSGYAMSLAFADKDDANMVFASLCNDGGKVRMPMEDRFWGDYFGVVTDKFRNRWNVSYNKMNAEWLASAGGSTSTVATATPTSAATPSKSEEDIKKPKMKVNIYRNFQNGKCAEAFDFYKSVFGGEFTWKAEWSMAPEGTLANVEQDGTKIMHMGLALTEGVELMGADDVPMNDGQAVHLVPPTTVMDNNDMADNSSRSPKRQKIETGNGAGRLIPPSSVTNNVRISISPESKERADELLAALSADGGVVQMPMGDQFWGSYFGMCMDRFGTQWMFDYFVPAASGAAGATPAADADGIAANDKHK